MNDQKRISSWLTRHEISLVLAGAILAFLWTSHAFSERMLAVEERCVKNIEEFHKQMNDFKNEMKNIHGRVCLLEERSKV